jgi:hypothetical protein
VPKELRPFRDEGLELLVQAPIANRIPIHWGMIMATYPFFGTVVDAVGRLIQLQGTVTFAQVTRRVQEKYGERESIHRATQRVFYGLHDWGVLTKTDERTVYAGAKLIPVSNHQLVSWLVEAAMMTTGVRSTPLNTAAHMPVLFPFSITSPHIAESKRLELFRQGLDNDVIMRSGALVNSRP